MVRKTVTYLALTALILLLNNCAASDVPDAKPTTGRNPTVAEVPDSRETVRGEDDPPIVTLDLGSLLHERHLSNTDEIPAKIIVPTTNLEAVPITSALEAVLSGTDISLSWNTGSLGNRLVTVMNVSGSLPHVIEKICSAAKVFCVYRHGSLELAEKETFIVSLPPSTHAVSSSSISSTSSASSSSSAGSASSIIDAINQLTGGKSQVDPQGGNIIYTTDVDGQDRVHTYLEQLRNGRPLVVLQFYVWEVTLDSENAQGINWTDAASYFGGHAANLVLNSASAFTSIQNASGNVGIGAITTGKLNTNTLVNFLATQGRVQTISSPQVTFISGSSASLKVGGTVRYISQVGTNIAGGTGNANTNTSTNTVTTDNIDTGLSVDVDGVYENGLVFANLNLSLKNLVTLNPTTTGGQTIDLPQTSDERMNTAIRIRPGDNLVMAGLVTSSDNNQRQGLPIGTATLPGFGDDKLENRELVVVVRPSVVLFSDKIITTETKRHEAHNVSPAVMIDRDGTATVNLPEATPTPGSPTQISGSPQVNRSMMQVGFSEAFDTPNSTSQGRSVLGAAQ